MEQIRKLLDEKQRVCVAIDGRCGAGKSTLADRLAAKYGGAVIRMDHFYLPLSLRGKDRINVHYERFEEEVVTGLKSGRPFSYRIFDCRSMDYGEEVLIGAVPLIIVEGAYSMLPRWEVLYDFKIFADVSKKEQKKRIISRNGEEGYRNFENKWIPMEEKYFTEYDTEKRCDCKITL